MPKVSVCIPTYNRMDYLVETLESVFTQSYRDFEVVIVDDGSTDGTRQIFEQKSFPVNIRYHWQENAGDAAARNSLIDLARGEYISFIDSDDLLMPKALEKMVSVMDSEPEDLIVYGGYIRIDEHGNTIDKNKRKLYNGNITKHLFQDIIVHTCGSLFPRKALVDHGGFDTSLRVCSDYSLWLQLSLKYKFRFIDCPTFKRRRHGSNLSVPSYLNRLTELQVLERFYHEQGGDKIVSAKAAYKRLSKEEYRVAKAAFLEGNYDMASTYFAKSFWMKPNFKSLIHWFSSASKIKEQAGALMVK
jgi:glycosyltransferase involved in cell wall biosynthesis